VTDSGWAIEDTEPTGDEAEPTAMFVLGDNPGLLVNVDDEDNDAGHAILHSDSGTKVSFVVFNVGTAAGSCVVDIEVNNTWIKNWTSSDLQPGGSESVEVKGLGRYSAGWYEFLVYVNPGAGYADHLTNNVDIIDP
jgi:hypothetical protein